MSDLARAVEAAWRAGWEAAAAAIDESGYGTAALRLRHLARTQPTAEPRTVAPGGFSESYALAPEPRTVETDERAEVKHYLFINMRDIGCNCRERMPDPPEGGMRTREEAQAWFDKHIARAETDERWECGPHANAWGGHDARCRRTPARADDPTGDHP